MEKIFITDVERKKCRKVAEAFAGLEDENIIVLDVGRYGFIKLEYYPPSYRFEDVITFTDSQTMFENLWYEWLYAQINFLVKNTPLVKLDYEDILMCLPREKQRELMDMKIYFAEKTGIEGILSKKENYFQRKDEIK